eukprot:m.62100 g.62100  ORF g.62100 m.62100 type:complete len:117 (+) comp11485_c1_seq1:799-1149(+)
MDKSRGLVQEKPKDLDLNASDPEDFSRETLIRISTQLLLHHGFHGCRQSALHLVAELTQLYIEQISRLIAEHAAHNGRSEGNVHDFGQALALVGLPTVQGLKAFLEEELPQMKERG